MVGEPISPEERAQVDSLVAQCERDPQLLRALMLELVLLRPLYEAVRRLERVPSALDRFMRKFPHRRVKHEWIAALEGEGWASEPVQEDFFGEEEAHGR